MWHIRAGLVALLVLSSACGATRATPTSAPEPSSDQIPVQIDNQTFNAMEVYVVTLTIKNVARGDGRVRLGSDPATSFASTG